MNKLLTGFFVKWQKKAELQSVETAFEAGWKACAAYTPPEAPREDIPYKDIINKVNAVLSRDFKATDNYRDLIKRRWEEGMREKDFLYVCEVKKEQWEPDPEMRIYLRPITLFGTKMDNYRNEDRSKAALEDWQ